MRTAPCGRGLPVLDAPDRAHKRSTGPLARPTDLAVAALRDPRPCGSRWLPLPATDRYAAPLHYLERIRTIRQGARIGSWTPLALLSSLVRSASACGGNSPKCRRGSCAGRPAPTFFGLAKAMTVASQVVWPYGSRARPSVREILSGDAVRLTSSTPPRGTPDIDRICYCHPSVCRGLRLTEAAECPALHVCTPTSLTSGAALQRHALHRRAPAASTLSGS